jgi:hypothetical protein
VRQQAFRHHQQRCDEALFEHSSLVFGAKGIAAARSVAR